MDKRLLKKINSLFDSTGTDYDKDSKYDSGKAYEASFRFRPSPDVWKYISTIV
jgi:hypothetical protein